MADISKIKLGSTIYSLKDEEVRAAVTALQTAVASSLVFKGVVSSAAGIISLTNYKQGWTYKANKAFEIPLIGTIEAGDMIICVSDYNSSYKASDWTVVQNNVDTMVGATSAKAGTRGLVPAPAAGESEKYLRGDGTWGSPSTDLSWGAFTDLV